MRVKPINAEVIGLDGAITMVREDGATFEFVPWEDEDNRWVYRVFLRTKDGAQIDVLQKHSVVPKVFLTYKALYLFNLRVDPKLTSVKIPVLPQHVDEALKA